MLRDVARALAYAHDQGVIHRDIKPENILLSAGTAVVTDFGIAKAINAARTADGSQPASADGTLTQIGSSVGTPAYMAPEQAVGEQVNQRADLYAWGVVAYELLSGVHPFAGRTGAAQLIAAHIAETPQPLAVRTPTVPGSVAALVMQCLAKDPDARPHSASLLLDALTGMATTGESQRPSPVVKHRRQARVVAGVVVVVVALVASSIWWQRGKSLSGRDAATVQVPGAAGTHDTMPSPTIEVLAVLPFVNTSGDAADEYFSDGLTGELAHALSRLPKLGSLVGHRALRPKAGRPPPRRSERRLVSARSWRVRYVVQVIASG